MTDDWFDIIAAFIDADARFVVVGAHAMAVHGVPRGTQDLDLWIEPTAPNVERVWRALNDFGAPIEALGISKDDFMAPNTVVQFGLPPNRIDLLTSLSGIEDFGDAWADRTVQTVRGRDVPFLGRASLVATKLATGRTKDLADLEALGEA